jgi:hypothetical protein
MLSHFWTIATPKEDVGNTLETYGHVKHIWKYGGPLVELQ